MSEVEKKPIDFMGFRKIASVVSIALIVASIALLAVRGLNLGLDFTGGTSVELEYQQAPALDNVRQTLEGAGYEQFVVQNFGSDTTVLVRMAESENDKLAAEVTAALSAGGNELELVSSEFVGSQVGDELKEDSGLGMLIALAVVLIYVGMRFQFKFGIASVVPLAHDVIIVLGVFALFQWTFDLSVLAALLAVIGYSLNDTIVVADRIRENFRKMREGGSEHIINESIHQTISRTINTSGTTLVVLFALYFLGGYILIHLCVSKPAGCPGCGTGGPDRSAEGRSCWAGRGRRAAARVVEPDVSRSATKKPQHQMGLRLFLCLAVGLYV